jgi:UDP-glucose 4-epimerase
VKILITGASSFTGMWFVRELAQAGHEVVATFRKRPEEYPDDIRRQRVAIALKHCKGVFGCSFGDPAFVDLVQGTSWDIFCHHAADVTNYRSPDFDVVAALGNNTRNLSSVLRALRDSSKGQAQIVITGSFFANDEGAGSQGLPAFSPYGLSKGLTYQVFRYEAEQAGLALSKFVIPNPFGPYEEPRFPAYLMKTWYSGKVATVNTPEYIRDNIHVSLLAKVYAKFLVDVARRPGASQLHPIGYAETQGAFTLRFAHEMRSRLGLACEVDLKQQTEFQEPRVRINTDFVDRHALGWDERIAWDEIAEFYRARLSA